MTHHPARDRPDVSDRIRPQPPARPTARPSPGRSAESAGRELRRAGAQRAAAAARRLPDHRRRRHHHPRLANTVGPRFFPYLVGGATIAGRRRCWPSGSSAATKVRRRRARTSTRTPRPPGGPSAIIALAFLAHALLINVIGWPLAVTLMFGVVAWALGARGIIRPLLAGGITSVDHLAGLRQGARRGAARRHPARARDGTGS